MKQKLTTLAVEVADDVAEQFDLIAVLAAVNRSTLLRWAVQYTIRHGARRIMPRPGQSAESPRQ